MSIGVEFPYSRCWLGGKVLKVMKMSDFNLKSVNVKLSIKQEQQVVVASLRKHCFNLERELLQHAIGNDCMTPNEVADNLAFIDSAMYVMRHYGD